MIGNDIIDLSCAPSVTKKHLLKYFSNEDLVNFGEEKYWEILALKESAWKCMNKLIGLNSFIPPHFTVHPSMLFVSYDSFILPVVLLEKNKEFIHTIVGTQGVTDWKICSNEDHRSSFTEEYTRRWGFVPNVVRVKSKISPNGMSPPIVINDPRTSVSFTHDGRFSAFAYKIYYYQTR